MEAPPANKVAELPLQRLGPPVLELIFIIGKAPTVMVLVAVLVQPAALVPIKLKLVVEEGFNDATTSCC